jgi:hypothetical protein
VFLSRCFDCSSVGCLCELLFVAMVLKWHGRHLGLNRVVVSFLACLHC